jgi:hypothetical protein
MVQDQSPTKAATALPGARGMVGPDVALSDSEKTWFSRCVTVEGRTDVEVQAACGQAVESGMGVVFLPAGDYLFATSVHVPGGTHAGG